MNSDTITEPALLDASGQPQKISRYVLKSILGRGAAGVVYLSFDPQSRKEVVLRLNKVPSKVIDYWSQISADILAISSKISHDSTPRLLDLGIYENSVFLIHEYIPGETLEQILLSDPVLDNRKILSEFMRAAEALDQAHSFRLIHSDLKPANFVINSENNLYLLDLSMSVFRHSCAKYSEISEESSIIGTPAYLSPEQIKDRHSDARSDLFSFAAVVFKALTNQQPFEGHSYTEITHSILNEPEKSAYGYNQQLGKGVDQIFKKALAKDSSQRYSSACQFILALQQILIPENKSLRAPTSTLITSVEELSKEGLESSSHNQEIVSAPDQNFEDQLIEVSPDKEIAKNARHSANRKTRTNLTIPALNFKTLKWIIALVIIFFIAILVLALYPRETSLVLENDPDLSLTQDKKLTEPTQIAENDTAIKTKLLVEADLALKKAEAKAIIESIIGAKAQDVILPELLKSFQVNQLIHQDINFVKLFKHESYLVKVSVIKKVIETKALDYLPQIRLALSEQDPLVRGFAVKAIGILGAASDKEILIKSIDKEQEPEVKQAMINALKRLESSVIQ